MKRILILVLDILLLIIMVICMHRGVKIGPLHILSFQDIANANAQLTQEISNAEAKNSQYNSQLETIKTDSTALTKAKKAYLDLVTISTESEIQEALQTKTYSVEYLWSQVGNHATKEGVVTRMELVPSNIGNSEYKNLNFTITGSYLAMTNFISDIENDSDLDFTIDGFDMTSGKASFVVKDIKIKKENTSVTSNTPTSGSNNSNTTKDNSSKSSTNTNTTSSDNSSKSSTNTNTSSSDNSSSTQSNSSNNDSSNKESTNTTN